MRNLFLAILPILLNLIIGAALDQDKEGYVMSIIFTYVLVIYWNLLELRTKGKP